MTLLVSGGNCVGGCVRDIDMYLDMSFIANFLLTYRSFCTTEEFVELLQERYNLAPPEELTPDELEIWTDKKQKLVRLR